MCTIQRTAGRAGCIMIEDTAQATFLDGIAFVNDSIGFIWRPC